MTMTLIDAPDRAAWLDARRRGIGSSDAAAVLGVDPHRTPLMVYCEKRGLAEPFEGNFHTRRGLAVEPVILDEAERLLGSPIADRQVFCASADRPWQLATLDGLTADGRVVEAKSVGRRQWAMWGEEGTDDVPMHYLAQVQHQLAVTGRDEAVIAADLGGEVVLYRVRRDERLIGRMVEIEAAFWAGVLDGIAPPVTDAADVEVLARLHPVTDAAIDLPPDVAAIVDRYAEFGRVAREAEAQRALAKAELLAALGDAGRGTLPDGREVVRSLVSRPEHSVKACQFQALRVRTPR